MATVLPGTARPIVRCLSIRGFLREIDGRLVEEACPEESVDLTVGKLYAVIGVERGWYRIVDDTGEDYLYPPYLFEVVCSSV